MDDAIEDAFAKKLIETACNADRPRPNISLGLIMTHPLEEYREGWEIRATIIALDRDKKGYDVSMGTRLLWRDN